MTMLLLSSIGVFAAICMIVTGLNGLQFVTEFLRNNGLILLGTLLGVASLAGVLVQILRPRSSDSGSPEEIRLLPPPVDEKDQDAVIKRVEELQQRYARIRRSRDRQQKRVLWFAWAAVAALIVAAALTVATAQKTPAEVSDIFLIGLSVLSGCVALAAVNVKRMRVRGSDEDIRNLEFEADLLNYKPTPEEQRAQKLLSINQYQLRKYYELTLTQGFWIFVVGVACLLAGLAVIAATFVAIDSSAGRDAQQIVVGVVGAVGAVLTNYVAAVYLKMHASIASNLSAFHGRLVTTNELFFANVLASRVVDQSKQSEVIGQMALAIAQGTRGGVTESVDAV